jgi:hypothetical protein
MTGRGWFEWASSFLSRIKGVKQEAEGDCDVCVI